DEEGINNIEEDVALESVTKLLKQVQEEYEEAEVYLRKFYEEPDGHHNKLSRLCLSSLPLSSRLVAMKLQSVGHTFHSKNCFLLKLRQITILFNCPLELDAISATSVTSPTVTDDDDLPIAPEDLFFSALSSSADCLSNTKSNSESSRELSIFIFRPPDFSLIDISTIDFVLITNHKHMLGLPFLTEYLGFKGKIFATEPVVEFGRQHMEELVHYFSSSSSGRSSGMGRLGHGKKSSSSEGWRPIYTLKDVKLCIDKVQQVRYREQLILYDTLKISAYSAGHSLGSANWQIGAGYEQMAFLSSSSTYTGLHPSSFDVDVLKDARVVIVSDLRNGGDRNGGADDVLMEKTMNKVCGHVARTLKRSGNVLFPISTTGIVFDLIGSLREHLANMGIDIGVQTSRSIPFYMISPVADKSLQYSNICGEWMHPSHQDLVYVPEAPLPHGELLESNRLRVFPSFDAAALGGDFREPCVVFTGDWRGLRQGPVDWFWRMWGNKSTNTCLFTETDIDYRTLLTTLHHTLRMDMVHCPIDTRLSFNDVRDMIRRLDRAPQFVLVPKDVKEDNIEMELDGEEGPTGKGKEWKEDQSVTTWKVYGDGEVVGIDVDRGWERVMISEKLAKTIRASKFTNGGDILNTSMVAPLTGVLSVHNNRYELHPVTTPQYLQALQLNKQRSLWGGNVKVERVLQELHKLGVPLSSIHVNVNSMTQSVILTLPADMHAQIEFRPQENMTVIEARDEDVRVVLRDIIVGGLVEV
ncbi:beta-lactamase-like protein, partial [Jimgerdemannia flammicorona]